MEKNLKPIGSLIIDSWNLYKKNINAFALISVIPFLFAGVKMVLQPYNFAGLPTSLATMTVTAIFSLLYLVFVFVMPLAVTIAVDEVEQGKIPDANIVYKRAFSLIIPYLFIMFLVCTITFGGLILFIIPGIIASIYLSLALYVFLFEKKTSIEALVDSAWYVRNFWWDILARKIVLAVLILAVIIGFSIVFGSLIFAFGFGLGVFQFLFGLFVFMVIVPFSFTFYYCLYRDIKSTKLARGEAHAPDTAFAAEAEKLFIILIIVAAAVALGFFCITSFFSYGRY